LRKSRSADTRLLERGLQWVIEYGAADLTAKVRDITEGHGIDVIVETVGGDVFRQAQDALAPLGRIVITGVAGGQETQPDVATLLSRSATCATFNLSVIFAHRPRHIQEVWARLTDLYEAGRLLPRIGHRFTLAQAADAHRLLESRASMDKILLDPRGRPA
jgi:NADPH2:quinone reductase